MKRSDMLKEIKGIIRANSDIVFRYQEGEISYGVMAEHLAKEVLKHIEEKGMLPPCIDYICNINDWEKE